MAAAQDGGTYFREVAATSSSANATGRTSSLQHHTESLATLRLVLIEVLLLEELVAAGSS